MRLGHTYVADGSFSWLLPAIVIALVAAAILVVLCVRDARKKKLLAILAAILLPVSAIAGDITLTTPVQLPALTKVTVDGYKYDTSTITVWFAYRTDAGQTLSSGTVILADECVKDGAVNGIQNKAECETGGGTWNNWFSAVENDLIIAGDVGKKTSRLLEKKIRQQVKQKIGIVGTLGN